MDPLEVGVASAIMGAICGWFGVGLERKKSQAEKLRLEAKVRELEKQIHLNETGFLEHKNQIEIDHRERQRALTEVARKEGFEAGLEAQKLTHQIEVAQLKAAHQEALVEARALAVGEARNQFRQETELQTKLFSVLIKPYVKIEKNKGLIFDDMKSLTGYQYQLMVNGIPAFQPHLVIEHTEDVKEMNEAKVKALAELAIKAANQAAQLYLSGASNSALKMGDVVIERIVS